MLEISGKEVDNLQKNTNVGYLCFMGGVDTDAPKKIVAAGDKFFLFERDEEIPFQIKAQLEKDAKEFAGE